MHRLLTRPQFQAALSGVTVARTGHFALHRCAVSLPQHGDTTVTSAIARSSTEGVAVPSAVAAPTAQSTTESPDASLAPFHRTTVPAKPMFNVDGVWLGAMVPKRWARRAVTRNLVKRQIYAIGAACEDALPAAAHVVRLRSSFDRKQFPSAASAAFKATVRAELQALFAQTIAADGMGNAC